MSSHFRACTLCEAMCGIAVDERDGGVGAIRGDKEDPFSRGHVCPKAVGLKDVHEDPDRLKRPLRRDGSSWREVGWEEAFDDVARRLRAVQKAHGAKSVAVYQGNPTVHNYGSLLFSPLFVRTLRTKSRFSATSVDQLPQMLAALLMFGHQLLVPIPDLDRAQYLLVLGANPAVSNGSLMTAPDAAGRIRAIRARGGRVVVVDPRRTETAAIADQHLFIRPGKDALFLAALAQTLFAEGKARLGHCAPFTRGLDAVRAAVEPFTPDRVADLVGIDAATIRQTARDLAAASKGVVYGRVGICTQDFGGLASWLVNVLNVITGNFDREGGAMFTSPAVDVVSLTGGKEGGSFGRWRTRVRKLPEFGGELPVAALAEEIETPGAGQIRALVTSAGNPVLSTPNGRRLDAALGSLDFMVSVDPYLNETTRHAHVILPPTFGLEHDHYDLAFHVLAIRNTAKYSPALFARGADQRHDWEIFNALTERMGPRDFTGRLKARAQAALLQKLGPDGVLDLLLRFGPYGDKMVPGRKGLSLKALRNAPHGIDLGAMKPTLPGKLKTKGKVVELAPQAFLDDVPRLLALLDRPRARGSLELIGRRELRSNNSWMHNSLRLVKGPKRCTLRVSPVDAAARGLAHGAMATVTSRVGRVQVPVEISDEMMPGVVSLPHGYGHDRSGVRLGVAQAHAGVSLNDLTDEARVDPLSGNASFSGVEVQVAALVEATEAAGE